MMIRNFSVLALIATALPLLVAACGGGDDDNEAKTPATCAAVCAQQNRLCSTNDDCDMVCGVLAAVVARTGCQMESQEGLDCLAEKNICDEQSTACPAESFDACFAAFCSANATDPLCIR